MNNDKIDNLTYGVIGLTGIITGGTVLGLSKLDKLKEPSKVLKIVGGIALAIGLVFTIIFGDSNLYPDDIIEEE